MRLGRRRRPSPSVPHRNLAAEAERRVQDHHCAYRETLEALIVKVGRAGVRTWTGPEVLRAIGADAFIETAPGTDPLTGCAPVTPPQ